MRSIKGEILRYRFLTDSEVSYLASTDPRFLRDPDEFCPTCGGEKSYKFRGTVYECDCQLQWQLWKHYSVSNIGSTYQRLDWTDYTSEERGPFETAILFRDNFKELISRGLGLLFGGGVGVGKTMLLSLLLKDLVKSGVSCYSSTATQLIETFDNGYHDYARREFFEEKTFKSEVLLLDDLGRERETVHAKEVIETILRRRTQAGQTTLITTNKSKQDLEAIYPPQVLSLIFEKNRGIWWNIEDFRAPETHRGPSMGSKQINEVLSGERRPIF